MKRILSVILTILLVGVLAQRLSEWESVPPEQPGEEFTGESGLPGASSEADPKEHTSGGDTQEGTQTGAYAVNGNILGGGTETKKEKQIIFIGDSRTVGLYCAMTYSAEEFPSHIFYHISPDYTGKYENTTFVAKGGEGYYWFSVYGAAMAVTLMQNYGAPEDTVIAVWLGVNDLDAVESYISYMNGTLKPFGAKLYYILVGPCDGGWADSGPGVLNFNALLQARLDPDIHLIDAYSFIQAGINSGQFATLDGLHYNYETCRAIYQFLMDSIAADNP